MAASNLAVRLEIPLLLVHAAPPPWIADAPYASQRERMQEQELFPRRVAAFDLQQVIEQGQHVGVHRPHQSGKPTLVIRVLPAGVMPGAVVMADECRPPHCGIPE